MKNTNTIHNNWASLVEVAKKTESILPIITLTGGIICDALKKGSKLYSFGNGGSSCDALHLAEELTGRYRNERRSLPGICLNADVSLLTCIGNDYGYDEVFARPVTSLVQRGDIVVGFSTSGNSKNVLRGLAAANELGAETISLMGKDGGITKGLAKYEIIVPSNDTARIQEIHTFILHSWLELIESEEWL